MDVLRQLVPWLAKPEADTLTQDQEQLAQLHDESKLFGAALASNRAQIERIVRDEFHGDWTRLLKARGAVGETIWHIAFLYPSPEKMALARWLLEKEPRLCATVYEAENYRGENALHMAVANRFQPDDVRWLVQQAPELVHGRATGTFFQPGPEGQCPWGELPLSFAVAVNEPELVRLLVEEAGADMLARDSRGNTAMHIAVLQRQHGMVKLLEALWNSLQARRKANRERLARGMSPQPPSAQPVVPLGCFPRYSEEEVPLSFTLFEATNNDAYTPMVLAAKEGDVETFRFMYERVRITEWKYSHVTAFSYPLQHVDDIWDIMEEQEDRQARERRAREDAAAKAAPRLARHSSSGAAADPDGADSADWESAAAAADSGAAASSVPAQPASLLQHVAQRLGCSRQGGSRHARRGRTALQLLTDEDFEGAAIRTVGVMDLLLQEKWKRYGRAIFLRRLVLALIYLAVLTGTVVLRNGPPLSAAIAKRAAADPAGTFTMAPPLLVGWGFGHFAHCTEAEAAPPSAGALPSLLNAVGADPRAFWCNVGVAGEALTLLGAGAKLAQSAMEAGAVGLYYFFRARGATRLERSISIIGSGLIFVTAAMEGAGGMEEAARFTLSVACITSWLYLLWFALGFRLTGPMVVMLQNMLKTDLARFLAISIIVLAAFSLAFFVLAQGAGMDKLFLSLATGFSGIVSGDLGSEDESSECCSLRAGVEAGFIPSADAPTENEAVEQRYMGIASQALQLAFLLIGNVMLLNLLVAMMADTYSSVKEKADHIWYAESARITLQLEASMSVRERLDKKNCYFYIPPGSNRPFLRSIDGDVTLLRAEHNDASSEAIVERLQAATCAIAEDATKSRSSQHAALAAGAASVASDAAPEPEAAASIAAAGAAAGAGGSAGKLRSPRAMAAGAAASGVLSAAQASAAVAFAAGSPARSALAMSEPLDSDEASEAEGDAGDEGDGAAEEEEEEEVKPRARGGKRGRAPPPAAAPAPAAAPIARRRRAASAASRKRAR